MALSDVSIRSFKPAEKLVKLSDGGGLQLWVFPDGAKRWRLAYRFAGKQKLMALGVYPRISLKEARSLREEAKRKLAGDLDPIQQKQVEKVTAEVEASSTFQAISSELIEKKRREQKAETTIEKTEWLLSFALPSLGPRPIAKITGPEILAILRPVEARGRLETARRLRSVIGEVFRYAVATSRADIDPTFALRGAISTPKVNHRAAITTPEQFGGLMRAVDGYEGTLEVRIALQLLALTFVRPGELRNAVWPEFDLEKSIWTIPGERMKMRRPHRVPLAPRTIELLAQLRRLNNRSDLLFPSVRSLERPVSDNTFNAALRRLGYAKSQMTSHGFRAAASSMLNESGLWNPDAIEAQLAHVEGNDVRRAYARSEYWDERVRMMTWWAEHVDRLKIPQQR